MVDKESYLCNSVLIFVDYITEGRGFESHLELGFFSESPLDAKISCCISIKGSLGGIIIRLRKIYW